MIICIPHIKLRDQLESIVSLSLNSQRKQKKKTSTTFYHWQVDGRIKRSNNEILIHIFSPVHYKKYNSNHFVSFMIWSHFLSLITLLSINN